MKKNIDQRFKRKRRIRPNVLGTGARPRVSVFKSNRHIYVQVIDDSSGKTLLQSSTLDGKNKDAGEIGRVLAKKALQAGISSVVFDRSGYKYHGLIKSLAEGARDGGLKF